MSPKRILNLLSIVSLAIYLSGCAGTAPSAVKKENIHNIKDYLIQSHPKQIYSYHIIGEEKKRTLLSMTSSNVLSEYGEGATYTKIVFDDLDGYCKMIGGESIYGKLVNKYIKSFNYIENMLNISYMNKAAKDNYDGLFKCVSSKDAFEVKNVERYIHTTKHNTLSGLSRYWADTIYLIEHKKEQPLGYETRWLRSNPNTYEVFSKLGYRGFINDNHNTIPFSYNAIKSAQIACSYYGGQFHIANSLTHLKSINYGKFLIQSVQLKYVPQFDKDTKEYFWCNNTHDKSKNFQYIHKDGKLYFSQIETKKFKHDSHIGGNITTIDTSLFKKRIALQAEMNQQDTQKVTNTNQEEKLALLATQSKIDIIEKSSIVEHETSYNGSNGRCDLASVTTKSATGTLIKNYKKCPNSPVLFIGRTEQFDIDAVKPAYNKIKKSLLRNCRAQGKAIAYLSEWDATAKCVKNHGTDNMKVTVMMNDKAILIKHY